MARKQKESKMKPNMGIIDRALRILFAAVVATLYFAGILNGTAALVLGAIATISVVTSVVGFCPAYVPLKISTRRERNATETT
jgi:hypothetical protein